MFYWNAAMLTHLDIIFDCSSTRTKTWVVATDSVRVATPKTFSVWSFTEKLINLLDFLWSFGRRDNFSTQEVVYKSSSQR